MNVVLVDNLLLDRQAEYIRWDKQPHIGLIALIGAIERAGHRGLLFDPKIHVAQGTLRLDASLYQEAAHCILELNPDVVGFTSLGCNFMATVKIAHYVKLLSPKTPLLLGGPHATILDREILGRFGQFDVIVRGEADFTIVPLLEAIGSDSTRLSSIEGLTYRRGGIIWRTPGEPSISDLDSLPFPAYDKYPVASVGATSLRVEAGRGCPFNCTFCSTASFFGRKFRVKSAPRLVAECDRLFNTYGISQFHLVHDLFTVNRKKVLEFCEVIAGRGYTWSCSARMDCVDQNMLTEMARAGCVGIYYGIETGSPRMQRISKKHLDLEIFDTTLDVTEAVGISSTVSFITGYPEEQHEDQCQTLDRMGSCFRRDDVSVQLHLLTPEPGTELLAQQKTELAYDGYVSEFTLPSFEPDDSDTVRSEQSIFVTHHFFKSLLPRERHIAVTTIFTSLRDLGYPLLRYVLRSYDNQLSHLIDDIERWMIRSGRSPACDANALASFFAETFDSKTPVPGLVNYVFRRIEKRRAERRVAGAFRRPQEDVGLGTLVAGDVGEAECHP